ncbi:MAG: hypothetical protein AB2598_17370 [Candidatus Thiodiazotropha sp.]
MVERIRSRIARTNWEELPEQSVIAISVGLTAMQDGDAVEDPLNRADDALNKAEETEW